VCQYHDGRGSIHRRLLYKQLSFDGGLGNALLTLSPRLFPHDTLVAPLQCGYNTTFPYEVEKLTHHVTAQDVSQTEVQCSFAARLDEIELVESEYLSENELGGFNN